VARQVEKGGDFFAGPFLPAKLARRTMSLTHRVFGIRSCNEVITGERPRPCLEFDIGRCLAPCVASICSHERYGIAVSDTRLFLEGRNDELARQLHERMAAAAGAERYEEAAQARDALRTVTAVRDRQQKLATAGLNDRDVFGVKLGTEGAVVQVFLFRGGRVIDRFELQTGEAKAGITSEPELLEVALQQLYTDHTPPVEIHVSVEPSEREVLEAWLSSQAERKVRIIVPQRGDKKDMVELAQRNAAFAYRARFDHRSTAHYDALETLKGILKLPALPRRIECFDISTIQGSETVASLVVCEEGRMKRSEYRKFRIRVAETEKGPAPFVTSRDIPRFLDDFAAMQQVVRRRYARVLESGAPLPDLIVIDGGKGQLNAAYTALEELAMTHLVAIGLAKKEELVFTRDSEQPIAMDPHGPALRLLQRIRDEAHRFAVSFHRQARASRDLRSELDEVPGIGPRRRKMLLTHFGSLTGVRRATREELTGVVGSKAADALLQFFASH
jgi:excinuclease ABC subunit C